jgi:hypothetical protein
MGTDFTAPTWVDRLIRALLFFVPAANPGYEAQLPLVREWLIEFDEGGHPAREIGLDASGVPLVSGPDDVNYGFWLDTNMQLIDCVGEDVSGEAFERLWALSASQRSDNAAGRPTMG